jgi:hypothetical protein
VQPSVFCLSLPLSIPQDQNLLMLAVLPFLHGILFSKISNLAIRLLSIVFCNLQFLSQFLEWIVCLYMTFKLISNTAKFCFPLPARPPSPTFPVFCFHSSFHSHPFFHAHPSSSHSYLPTFLGFLHFFLAWPFSFCHFPSYLFLAKTQTPNQTFFAHNWSTSLFPFSPPFS